MLQFDHSMKDHKGLQQKSDTRIFSEASLNCLHDDFVNP